MTAEAYAFGHPVYFVAEVGVWRFCDDHTPADRPRPCPRCGRLPTPEGYDACLGHIPGVSSACCGHGVEPPFLMLDGDVGEVTACIHALCEAATGDRST